MRRYIYEWPVFEDKNQMIANALEVYLAGVNAVYAEQQRPVKTLRPRIAAAR